MRRFLSLLLLVACVLPLQAQDAPSFSAEDVFELEWATNPQVSPDGQQVVYLRNGMDVMNDRRMRRLWIVNTDGTAHRKLTLYDGNESSPRWSPDGTRLAYVRGTDAGSEIFIRWMDTGQTARITQLDRSPSGLAWSPDGSMLAFSMLVPEAAPDLGAELPSPPRGASWASKPKVITRMYHEADGSGPIEPGYRHLFVVPAEGGTPRQVTSGDYQHSGAPSWLADNSGLVFSANRIEDPYHDFRESEVHMVTLDGTLTTLTDRNGPDSSPQVSPDGQQIAYLGYDDRVQTYQNNEVYVMNRDGSNRRILTEDLDISIGGLRWDGRGRGLYVIYQESGSSTVAHLSMDGTLRVVAEDIGGTAIGRPYIGGSFSVAPTGLIAYTHSEPSRPADVAVRQDGQDSFRQLTTLNEDLMDHRVLGDVETLTWQSSKDGRTVEGWMVTPPGFDPSQQYPLLLEIHGGPITAYGPHFSAEVQLYASAGYVVLYPNPRGSTGYGEEFANLLYHDFPGGDYEDLMSGVDAVLERGFIDPDRLYVTGGSAGGTMTAWIVGSTDRFRAAVVSKPVMNWYSKVLVADNWWGYFNYRYPGTPWENLDKYMEESPISVVGQVETPTMVMVGEEDLRTPLSESKQLYHALKYRKIDTALVTIPGAYHNIASRPSQLAAKVAYTVAWFERYK